MLLFFSCNGNNMIHHVVCFSIPISYFPPYIGSLLKIETGLSTWNALTVWIGLFFKLAFRLAWRAAFQPYFLNLLLKNGQPWAKKFWIQYFSTSYYWGVTALENWPACWPLSKRHLLAKRRGEGAQGKKSHLCQFLKLDAQAWSKQQ